MNAIPPHFDASGLTAGAGVQLALRWTALAGAARVVAQLADPQAPGVVDAAVMPPVALDGLRGGRQMLIEQGIDDMLAMMEPGLTALLKVQQQGGQTTSAANALWQEFLRARRGLAALAPIGSPR